MIRRPPSSPLFPSPTLFRSRGAGHDLARGAEAALEAIMLPPIWTYVCDSPSLPRRCCLDRKEHTSELQSQSNLVCRLLLEKKKKNTKKRQHIFTHTTSHTAN